MSGSVWAVVVAYDAPDTLADCLAALARQSHPVDRVIVVDNGSVPSARGGPGVEVIRPRHEHGTGGWVRHRVAVLPRRPRRARVGDGRRHHPGTRRPPHTSLRCSTADRPGSRFPSWRGRRCSRPQPAGLGRRAAAAPVVEAVGLPDERFFFWAEDTEYLHWRIPRAGFAHYDATGPSSTIGGCGGGPTSRRGATTTGRATRCTTGSGSSGAAIPSAS